MRSHSIKLRAALCASARNQNPKRVRALFVLLALVLLPAGFVQAQTISCQNRIVSPLSFETPQLVSDPAIPALGVGATYRYSNVVAGVDALVEIIGLDGVGSLSTIDNDGSLPVHFQPEFNAPGGDAGANFRFTFVTAGTSTPIEIDIAAGAIDIDGNNNNIRETAEFSIASLSELVLNAPTQLDVNASGPSLPSRIRVESRTTLVAPGIDPTAVGNIATALYSDISQFEYRIGALGLGVQTRLTSLDFTCPTLLTPIPITVTEEDFSDAPASFGNPTHVIVPGIRLGAAVSIDPGPFNSPDASADTNDDSATIPPLNPLATITVDVSASGAGGLLQAWIDWNADGDFLDAGEQIATNLADINGDGLIPLSINTPVTATSGPSFARLRWSTAVDVDPVEPAIDGEVEDYAITINERPLLEIGKTVSVFDSGDLPPFAVPGNDVLYTINVTNISGRVVDADSIFIVDALPTETEFFTGDVDGPAGPATGAASFAESSSGLTFDPSADLRFSDATTPPADFGDCNYSTTLLYDPAIRFICFNPKGVMADGTPNPFFSVSFRARIR